MIYMIKCKICNKLLDNKHFGYHLNKKHNVTLLTYHIKYENFKIPICEYCNKEAKLYRGITYRKTCGGDECKLKANRGRRHSPESREKMRLKKLEYYKNNPDKRCPFMRNRKSYIEKLFINLIQEESLDKKYDIINEYYIYPYSIDFAFENIKVAIELDGEFHLKQEKQDSDKRKDKLLLSLGWRILRIGSRDIKENYVNIKQQVLNFLNNTDIIYDKKYGEMLSYIEYKKIQKKIKNEKLIERKRQKNLEKRNKLNGQKRQILKILNKNENKFGIIKIIADEMELSHSHIRRLTSKLGILIFNRTTADII